MLNKLIYNYSDIEDKIISAVDEITDPVKQTMSPTGGNVIYEDRIGDQHVTMDGATIAKNIVVKDPVKNAIIEIIKGGSLQTNIEAGDGTSSTILLSSILIKEGLRLVRDGMNQMEVKRHYEDFATKILEEVKKGVIEVNSDEELLNIAKVSANNDLEIAKDIVETISVVGEDGQVIIKPGYGEKTEIIKETGLIVKSGVMQELAGKDRKAMYENALVFITDKRLYYAQEAETILYKAMENGYKDVVIIASDFIGEALPYFVTNHQQGNINVLLIKVEDLELLDDVADYLNGEIISDKGGKIVNKIEIGDFVLCKSIFSDPFKTIITNMGEKNAKLEEKVEFLKGELERVGNKNSLEYNKIKSRLSTLTRGMVTLRVGGQTPIEVNEKIFRYEDAVNAAKSAVSEGYVVGGGIALMHAIECVDIPNPQLKALFRKVCQANIRQIAENAGQNPEVTIREIKDMTEELGNNWGFNASTGGYGDLVKEGVIEPFKVLRQVVRNAISISNMIITSRYLIVNDIQEDGTSKETKN